MGLLSDEILGPLILPDRKTWNVCAGGGKRIELGALAETVAEIQDVLRRQVVIQAETELVVVGSESLRADVGGQPLFAWG